MERFFLVIIGTLALLVGLTLFSAHRNWHPLTPLRATPVTKEDVQVWVNTRSGFYYCGDSTLYGKVEPGKYMRQDEALQQGYRPFLQQACSR